MTAAQIPADEAAESTTADEAAKATEVVAADEATADEAVGDEAAGDVPVACSLSTAGLAEQAGRWARLAARAMTGYARTEDGLRLGFRPEPDVEEELRSLAAVETQCCPWAAWTVRGSRTQVVLDVRAAGDGIAALHGMLTGLRRASAPR